MRTQRAWAKALAAILLLCSSNAPAASGLTILELFTSEGCSSCVPAERYLGELSERPDVLALSFHVGYWDSLGWRDSLAFPATTERQTIYARRFRLASVYTPQLIVDGAKEFVGSDRGRIGPALAGHAQRVRVSITADPAGLRIGIGPDSGTLMSPGASDVVLVPFRRKVTSRIARGENAGREVEEYNVARELRVLGHSRADPVEFRVALASLPRDATDVAVLVQQSSQGEILGAASRSLGR